MRHILLILSILLSSVLCGQSEYYNPQAADSVASEHVMTKAESRAARKQERQDRKALKNRAKASGSSAKPKCYCPYSRSTSVWHDIVNDGIVGTGKAIYQSTIKPQVLGEIVGGVQGAANSSPLPTIAATTGIALATSEIHKARRHQRNKRAPRLQRACECNPCPYHGQRYGKH